MAFSSQLFVAREILSSEYQLYACGKISLTPRFGTKMLIFQGTLQFKLGCYETVLIQQVRKDEKSDEQNWIDRPDYSVR